MRIGDWSSDVCSSDLVHTCAATPPWLAKGLSAGTEPSAFKRTILPRFDCMSCAGVICWRSPELIHSLPKRSKAMRWLECALPLTLGACRQITCRLDRLPQIGRASGREGVCQYVQISVVAVSVKKKKKYSTNGTVLRLNI